MGAPRDVQVDARARDRAGEDVERHVADEACIPDVAAKVEPAEREVDLRVEPTRLTDERLHPLAPELVAVAVEEDVVLLLHGSGLEQFRVGGPEDRLRTARTELAQPVEPALRVREDEVVLGRVRAVVVVEARVHAAELGQAHRHVAVVEDHGHVEPLAQPCGYPAEVRHRHREDDHCRDVALSLEDPLDVALPPRRDVAPDRVARDLVADRVLGMLLCAPQQRVALEARRELARAGERAPPRGRAGSAPSATTGTRSHGRGTA